MDCFVCRNTAKPHVIKGLRSPTRTAGWARLCVPCAIKHELDGQLLAGPDDADVARQWLEYRAKKNTRP